MRLTNDFRRTFVAAVMDSIPRKHRFDSDAIKDELRQASEAGLPQEVRLFAKKYPNLIQRTRLVWLDGVPEGLARSVARIPRSIYVLDHEDVTTPDVSGILARASAYVEEEAFRRELSTRLQEIAASCTTLKALQDALPELVGFMPAEQPGMKKQLPVAAGGLVSELVSAGLAIPKGE